MRTVATRWLGTVTLVRYSERASERPGEPAASLSKPGVGGAGRGGGDGTHRLETENRQTSNGGGANWRNHSREGGSGVYVRAHATDRCSAW